MNKAKLIRALRNIARKNPDDDEFLVLDLLITSHTQIDWEGFSETLTANGLSHVIDSNQN